jgi:hypothetical protein
MASGLRKTTIFHRGLLASCYTVEWYSIMGAINPAVIFDFITPKIRD